ncbi:unnamed protein product [Albugo candida]|nr:unnamed protein product [Albugo candida]|eukprot:CCI44728.1 unnamed protein product [Albugo candida]
MVDVQKPGDFEDDFEDLDVDTLLEDQIIPSSGNKLTSIFNAQVERKKSRTRTNTDNTWGDNIEEAGLSIVADLDHGSQRNYLRSTDKTRKAQNEIPGDQMDLDQHQILSRTFKDTSNEEIHLTDSGLKEEKFAVKENDSKSSFAGTDRFASVASFFDQDDIQDAKTSAAINEPILRTSRQARRGYTSAIAKTSDDEIFSSMKQIDFGNSKGKRFDDPFKRSSRIRGDSVIAEKKDDELHARSSGNVRDDTEHTKTEASSRSLHGAPSALESLLFDLPPSPGQKEKEKNSTASGDKRHISDVLPLKHLDTNILVESTNPAQKDAKSSTNEVLNNAESHTFLERKRTISGIGTDGLEMPMTEALKELQASIPNSPPRIILDRPEALDIEQNVHTGKLENSLEAYKIKTTTDGDFRCVLETTTNSNMASASHTPLSSKDSQRNEKNEMSDPNQNDLLPSNQQLIRESSTISGLKEELEALKKSFLNAVAEKGEYKNKVVKLTMKKNFIKITITSLKQQIETMQQDSIKMKSVIDLLHDQKQSLEQDLNATKCLLTQEKQMHHSTQNQLKYAEQQLDAKSVNSLQGLERVGKEVQQALSSFRANFERIESDTQTKHLVEDEARLRMITTLDASSQNYSRKIQTECTRLSTLSNKLEALIGHFSLEHMENKERLRQEQSRLDLLTAHFKAQSTILNEKSDASVQKLSEFLAVSLHDHRSVEARVHTQQTTIMEQERKLQDDRSAFNAFREELLRQHEREKNLLQIEKSSLEQAILQHRHERQTFEELIASHEAEFDHLQLCRERISGEKNRLEESSAKIATMATSLEQYSINVIAREEELLTQKQHTEKLRAEYEVRSQSLDNKEDQLTQRERRLQIQQNKVQTLQKQLLVERNQSRKLFRRETSRLAHADDKEKNCNISALIVNEPTADNQPRGFNGLMAKNAFKDTIPSSLRKAMEENWKRSRWKQHT